MTYISIKCLIEYNAFNAEQFELRNLDAEINNKYNYDYNNYDYS